MTLYDVEVPRAARGASPPVPAYVVVVSGSVGAGHDGVARELADRPTGEGHRVEVVDLLEGFPWLAAVILGSAYLLTLLAGLHR